MIAHYFSVFILMTQNGQAAAALTVSSTGPICPQATVNFTCSTTSSYLRWTASLGTEMIEPITFAIESRIQYRILGRGYLLRASVVSFAPPDLISNLTLVAFSELNGLSVECNSESTGRERSVLHIASPPSHPDSLHVTGIHNDLYYATIDLQWNPPLDHNNHTVNIIHYVISIHLSSSDDIVWKAATEATTVALKVPYNINFTANAVAVNCAGSGIPAQLETLNIVNCSIPPAIDGLVIEPYNATTEGVVIIYRNNCAAPDDDIERRAVVCTSNGSWSPQIPRSGIDCEAQVSTSAADKTEILFQCDKGSGKFFALCTQDSDSSCFPLPVSTGCGNYSETDSNDITKFVIFGGIGGAGLAMGAIIICLILTVYRLILSYRSKRQDLVGIEVENNAAYETVNFQKIYAEVQ